MKKIVIIVSLLLVQIIGFAQSKPYVKYVEASDLTLVGKLFNDTPNPYHRVDTCTYKGWTEWQNFQVRCCAGVAAVFRTDSPFINVKTEYGGLYSGQTTNILSHRGYDLYIRKDGKWLYAGSGVEDYGSKSHIASVAQYMDGTMKECLLYFPMYSEVNSVQIGVQEESTIEAIDNPFRHRVAVYGSSYTQGVCTSRSGMSYPAIFSRSTGIQIVSLAMSGQCKMQDAATNALMHAPNVDAFIFDTFSNPDAPEIEDRLFDFIEKIQSAHPGKPLIFQQTIYREYRNFNTVKDAREQIKMETAARLMKEACKKYKDVYFIIPNATTADHEAQVDGIHPSDYGYQIWEKSIEKQVLKILRKYGIR